MNHEPVASEPVVANPYLSGPPAAPLPDLDAAAPGLRSVEAPRLNRRALGLLAGIVLLLVLLTAWMLHSATSGHVSPRKRDEAVVIPDLPRVPAMPSTPPGTSPGATPMQMQAQDIPPLPVLPPPPVDPRPQALGVPPAPPPPTLVQRRMGEVAPADPGSSASAADPLAQALLAGLPGTTPPAAAQPQPAKGEAASAQFLQHPDALLARGTYIRCILESRVVTDVPGFAACVVTEPVYSINGRRLLLPRGSRVSGRYGGEPNGPRVAVVWDRVTTPTGIDVAMASPGVDGLGSAGHPGDYDAHWGSRIGSALLVSLISDGFRYAAAEYGPPTTTVASGIVTQSPFESTTARTMERLANQALTRAGDRPPTVTIPQGTLLNVYVARDVDFSSVLPRP